MPVGCTKNSRRQRSQSWSLEGTNFGRDQRSTRSATSDAKSRARAGILFIVVDLRQSCSPFVPLFGLVETADCLVFYSACLRARFNQLTAPKAFGVLRDQSNYESLVDAARSRENLRTQRAVARRSWLRRRLVSLRAGAAHAGEKFSRNRALAWSNPQRRGQKPPRFDNVRLLRMESSYAVRYLLPRRIRGNILSLVPRSMAETRVIGGAGLSPRISYRRSVRR